MSKPVIEYLDCMPVTLGEPAWVYVRGELGFRCTSPVEIMSHVGVYAPVFETKRARYEPAARLEWAYPNNMQHQPA